ncbi:MAG: type I toxin-antitoxin system SymE family toxin [Chloroflexi bacterium]|nr:type I toxin-antitoxin system SymE family toxin [Chloroflexota bacterium]
METYKKTEPSASFHRQAGKTLRVVALSDREDYVPSIRVAGKWLRRFGFELGEEVTLTASQDRIVIIRKEVQDDGNALV